MGEVRQLRWSWLGDLDRKYNRLRPQPQTYPPGCRPLPPSMSTARELFIVGRRFKLKLPRWHPDASLPLTVLRHTPTALLFVREGDHKLLPRMHARRLEWAEMESYVEQGYVLWLNSILTPEQEARVLREGKALQKAYRWALRQRGPDPSSS